MTNVHIVNHTHWDREWYFTSMDALVLSDQLFSDAIDELKKHPEASFVLDGQLSILDDYLLLYPERRDDIKELVTNKQLFIGPWYTQSDAFFTTGEAVLRNAMIGIFESKKYGEYMPIGYLPDTFGFNAQIPVILKEAGLESIIMWRGLHLNKHVKSPYFKWRGLNRKSEVTALNLPQGYGTGMLLEPTTEYVDGRLDPAIDFIKQYTDSEILIPSGNDQLAIIHDFTEKIEKINQLGKYTYQVSTYQDFLAYVKQQELEIYSGEFREPVLARVHKTIGSVRMDLKQMIFHLEDKLIQRIEPLMVLAEKVGIKLSNRLVMLAWKKLLESQAHDSLAGCVSDSVAEDIKHRLKEAQEICDSIENTILKQLADYLALNQNEILVVNTSPNRFKGTKTVTVLSSKPNVQFLTAESVVVQQEFVASRENILEETPAGNRYITEPGYYILTVELTCELPGLGYKVFAFEETENELKRYVGKESKISSKELSVEFMDGVVNLNFQGTVFKDFLSLVEEGNAGDTYDFSPNKDRVEETLRFDRCECLIEERQQKMILQGQMKLPKTMTDREAGQYNTTFSYQMTLTLKKEGQLSGSITFKNSIMNHRVRLQLRGLQDFVKAEAGLPFGMITRENQPLENWEEIYSEMPVNVNPFEKIVSGLSPDYRLTLFTQDSKEYEYQANRLWVTLLATTDSLGKPDLLYRPGRASGDTTKKGHIMMETPLAQQLGQDIRFDFDLRIDASVLPVEKLHHWKNQLLQPSVSYQKQALNYFVQRIDNKIQTFETKLSLQEKEYSLLDFGETELFISSLHRSYYDSSAFIVRFENPTANEIQLPVRELFIGNKVLRINAVEEPLEYTEIVDPYSVVTFLIK
ncbi:glycoside hydrolase family 38 C-terminal domain-containing protein [Candidatus Enterococcus murrayae]|uniref:Alpha-mannosidase n=1 Tax=Candidatus Enterococcus murrayae TaxID=2815321 RepID=A0ABS3HFY4_9ENTE|nr:glycoside hydrolase family 38 C-terminal domain-containing protein [Enterococcus sp. MJM16]MBO0451503.1 alpha-mannosidase [Enterococcus sp. MJM16]